MTIMQLQTIGVTVREFEVVDLDAVMQVESAAFGKHVSMSALSEQQAIELIRDCSHDTLVLQRGSTIFGYVVFETKKQSLLIKRLAVSYSLCGFGSKLVADIKRRMLALGKVRVEAVLDEYDVSSQKFFGRSGFKAVRIMEDDRSKYLFRFAREQR